VNRPVWLAVGALGATAVVTQLVLMRELLGAFAGNELVLGIVLGNWLLLTGLGTWLGRLAHRLRHPVNFLIGSLICIGIIPVMQVVAVRVLRDVVFTRGALVGVLETVLASGVVLSPFCILSGFMLTLACHILCRAAASPAVGTDSAAGAAALQNTAEIARVYVADTVGSIAGGVVFSFGLVLVLDHCGALLVPAALSLTVAAVLAWRFGCRVMLIVAGALLVSLAFAGRLDEWTTALQYRGQQVVFRGNSPYGRLVVTESAGQSNFIENGVPLFSTHNTEQIEETVHFALAQRPGARRVLLVGGGVTGTARELLKYPGVTVTYVELDPLILEAAPLRDPRIRVVNADGRRFIQRTTDQFDAVIVDMPEPSTLQLNRFFTTEFFAEVKQVLTPGGVLAFPLGQYANYVGSELARLLATADATVRQSFARTLLITGGRVFVLASDGELTTEIAGRLPAGTKWMNRNYLDATLTPDRLADLRRATAVPGAVNRDFQPVLYLAKLRHWLAMFPVKFAPVVAALGLALLVYLVRQRGPALVVFAGGFAASALEIVLVLGFQILYGSAYRQLGVLVTVFMAGLAAGAWWANQNGGPRFGVAAPGQTDATERVPPLALLAFSIAGLAAVLPGVIGTGWLIMPLTFALAGLVGMEFPVACRLSATDPATTASRLYTADFVGACVGALLTSTVLVPMVGVAGTCWITAGLNAVAGVMLWWRR
jgi:spermidine synthase